MVHSVWPYFAQLKSFGILTDFSRSPFFNEPSHRGLIEKHCLHIGFLKLYLQHTFQGNSYP